MEVMIRVENLSKVYNLYNNPTDRFKETFSLGRKNYHKEKYALENISFDVMPGESVGIIGTNGSGKSTLLKILSGVLHQTKGKVEVKGKVSALLELGAGFNPEYTGIENIFLNGRVMGFSRPQMEQKLDTILEFADIGEYVWQPVKTYSSGMFARLAFAIAINVDAEILVVDEALSVGDIFFQNKCFRKFEELQKKGVTILFVSHDIESVKAMTRRVLWIEQGKQQMFGDKLEVCNAYAKSILLKNNEMATTEKLGKDAYKKDKLFNLNNFPNIVPNSSSLLNENVEIKACLFLDVETEEFVWEVIGGKKYRLVIIFKSKMEIAQCIVGYVLQNKKGVSIINSNTLITGEKSCFYVEPDSMMRVEFEIVFPNIYADEYMIDCAVADGRSIMDNTMLTWCYGALRFFVHNEEVCLAQMNTPASVKIYEAKLGELDYE